MLKKIWKKITDPELLVYVVFGLLATVIDFGLYSIMCHILGEGYDAIANAISFSAAVTFAFFTNKPFVYKSKSWALPVVAKEFVEFLATRILAFLLVEAGLLLCGKVLHMEGMTFLCFRVMTLAKLFWGLFGFLINYTMGKFVVFAKGSKETKAKEQNKDNN